MPQYGVTEVKIMMDIHVSSAKNYHTTIIFGKWHHSYFDSQLRYFQHLFHVTHYSRN
jgi:hypothetical protein